MNVFLAGLALLLGLGSPTTNAPDTTTPTRPPGGGGFVNNGPALNGQHTRLTSEILPQGGIQLRVQGGQLLAIR